MKMNYRKILAAILAMAMVLSVVGTVWADDGEQTKTYTGSAYAVDGEVRVYNIGGQPLYPNPVQNGVLEGDFTSSGTDVSNFFYGYNRSNPGIAVVSSYDGPDAIEPASSSFTLTGNLEVTTYSGEPVTTTSPNMGILVASMGLEASAAVEKKVSIATAPNFGGEPKTGAGVAVEVISQKDHPESEAVANLTVGEGVVGQAIVYSVNGNSSLVVEDGGVTAKNVPRSPIFWIKGLDDAVLYNPGAVIAVNAAGSEDVSITGSITSDGSGFVAETTDESLRPASSHAGGETTPVERSAHTTVTLNGDINVNSEGNWLDPGLSVTGVSMYTIGSGSSSSLSLTGSTTLQTKDTGVGIKARSDDGGQSKEEVTGNVTVDVTGQGNKKLYAAGVSSGASGYGSRDASSVDGDISVTGTGSSGLVIGAELQSRSGGAGTLTVTGKKVEARAVGDDILAIGAMLQASGFEAEVSGEGVSINLNDSDGSVVVDGKEYTRYYTEEGEGNRKYYIRKYDSSKNKNLYYEVKNQKKVAAGSSTMVFTADVTGDGYGAAIKADENAKADLVIDGTVKGGEAGLVLMGDTELGENVHMTVWKVEPVNDAVVYRADNPLVAANGDGNEEAVTGKPEAAGDDADALVQYIIRISTDEDTFGNIGYSDETQSRLYSVGDENYTVANEGQKVIVKLTIPDGKELDKAFWDEDKSEELTLIEGSDGEYYMIVPRGGGVLLSMVLKDKKEEKKEEKEEETPAGPVNPDEKKEEKKDEDKKTDPESPKPDPKPDPKPEPKPEPKPDPEEKKEALIPKTEIATEQVVNSFDAFCNELARRIRSAPQNGTVEADAGDFPGLKRVVFQALEERSDVSLKLKTRDGEIIIPAGAGLLSKVSNGTVTWAEIRGLV